MQCCVVHEDPSFVQADILVFPVSEAAFSAAQKGPLKSIEAALGVDIFELAGEEGFGGKLAQTFLLRGLAKVSTRRVMLVGTGSPTDDLYHGNLRAAAIKAARTAWRIRTRRVAIAMPVDIDPASTTVDAARQLVEGFSLGAYRFNKYVSAAKDPFEGIEHLDIMTSPEDSVTDDDLHRSLFLAGGVTLARNLVNEPPAELTPSQLARQAEVVATRHGMEHHVLDETALTEGGFNLIMAVGQGSVHGPRLIHLIYRPHGEVRHRVAFVGKGVTFDTGGYSLKSTEHILHMHADMAGAAAVLGAAEVLGHLKPSGVELHFVIPSAENAISGGAVKPQDIIRGYGKKTVEILNTDAEGRLLLADALSYIQEYDVDTVIDLATLTGASVVALGEHTAALFSNHDALAHALAGAAERAGEHIWRMPLTQKLDPCLDTPVADMKNVGPKTGGAITAALFLKRWITTDKWAHIDLAGPAYSTSDTELFCQGGTGFGVATLVEYISRLADT